MARRGVVTVALAAGLTGAVALGGAGGFGYGLLATPDPVRDAGVAVPLVTSVSSTGTATPEPPVILPDNSPALRTSDLWYKTRSFVVEVTLRSELTARVPANWKMTHPDPPEEVRFNHPGGKRYLKFRAGMPIEDTPAIAMERKVRVLRALPANQLVEIGKEQVDGDGHATLTYTHVPDRVRVRRIVVMRWVAGESGDAIVELTVTGLPQDKAALLEVLDRATTSVTRDDSEL